MIITIDSVIRSYLHERGMPWHDYFRCLTIAISGLKDLARDIDLGANIKTAEIDVRKSVAVLPPDCVEPVRIAVPLGDKLAPVAKIDNLNPYGGGPDQRASLFPSVNDRGESTGRSFGSPPEQPFGYQRFGDTVRFDARLDLDCVLIVYTTTGVSVTDRNVVHPWAEEPLKAWIDWKFTEHRKGIWERQNEKKEYGNLKRLLYGSIHGVGWEDYLKTVRDNRVLTIKY